MSARARLFAVALVLSLLPGAVGAPVQAQGPVPISEGTWLGALDTSCTPESGLTRNYECDFEGVAPAEAPPGSHCTETPSGPIVVSLACAASLSASADGRAGRTGCITAPPLGQVLTTNGSVVVFSSATQQSYEVPVKVWVTRGAGNFFGVGNYTATAVTVSGSFSTDCDQLQSIGVFRGQFSIAVTDR